MYSKLLPVQSTNPALPAEFDTHLPVNFETHLPVNFETHLPLSADPLLIPEEFNTYSINDQPQLIDDQARFDDQSRPIGGSLYRPVEQQQLYIELESFLPQL